MKLIGNNGEVLAEWTAGGKRNLYCHGGFGLMLTKRALARCVAADDVETLDMFKASDSAPDQAEADAFPDAVKKEGVASPYCLLGYFFGGQSK